jgi:D-alanyl-D-alanine dipeptidase/carboxypeptidase
MVIVTAKDIHRGALQLVSAEYPIREAGEVRVLPLAEDGSVFLEKKAAYLLSQVFRALRSEGTIVPVSGYRSRREQEQIYRRSLRENGDVFTSRYVALPGCSEHQTGLAVDLSADADDASCGTGHPICPSFPDAGICGEFKDLAAKYGFIERYGSGKESLTGIAHEPWHFRYVGYPHSLFMQEKCLCLEEYITLLRRYSYEGHHLHYRQTEIYFADAETAEQGLLLPEECTQISGNNVDGFIVTIWRRFHERT